MFHNENIDFWIFSDRFEFMFDFSWPSFQTLSLLLNTMVDVFGRNSQTSTAVEASEIADLIDFLRVQASWNFLLYALKFYVFKEFTLTKLLCVSAIMLSIMKGREVLSRLTASLKQRFLPFVGGQQKVYVQICNIFFRTWNLIWILLYMLPLIQSWSRIPHDLWVLAFFTSRSWDGNALWTKIVIELNKLYISGAPCTADFTALCCLENKICKRVMMRITRYSQLLPTLSVMAKTFQF